jgi:hypothetical protein
MTDDEFKGLLGESDAAELEALAAEVEAEVAAEQPAAPKKDGLWYAHDGVSSDGHTISWYALNGGGKTVLWVSIDNDLEVSTAALGKLPDGITGHAIRVHDAERTDSMATNGIALRAPHQDGTGTHLDGQTVRSYVLPRALRYLGRFYGV